MKNNILENFILEMLKIDENTNALSISNKVKKALKSKKITHNQYAYLMSDLKMYCNRYCIEASNDIFVYSM